MILTPSRHELHLMRSRAGRDPEALAKEVIAFFTSLQGRPPTQEELAAMYDELKK